MGDQYIATIPINSTSLLHLIQGTQLTKTSKNTGTPKWKNGHLKIPFLRSTAWPFPSRKYVLIGIGDGSSAAQDWALFGFENIGKNWDSIFAIGGKFKTEDKYEGLVEIFGKPDPCQSLEFSMFAATQKNNNAMDSIHNIQMASTSSIYNIASIYCWNLDNTYMEQLSGPRIVFGQHYTHAYWIYWRDNDKGWRTLFQSDSDWAAIVKENAKELG